MPANPLDDFPNQLSGRLAAVEVLLALLLSEKANAGRILANAETVISSIEVQLLDGASASDTEQTMLVMNAARWTLDSIASHVEDIRRPRSP